MSRSNNHLRVAGLTIDLACILAALSCAGVWSWSKAASGPSPMLAMVGAHVTLFGVAWVLVSVRLGTYQIPVGRNLTQAVRAASEAWAVTWGTAGLVSVSLLGHPGLDIWLVLIAGFLFLAGSRLVLSTTAIAIGTGRPRTLVIGACSSARSMTLGKESQQAMYLVGFVPFAGEDAAEMPHLRCAGTVDQLGPTLIENRVDLALVCPSDRALTGDIHRVFATCDELGLGVQYFPSFLDLQHLHVALTWNANRPGLALHTPPNQSFAMLAKRAIDVVGAAAGVLVLLPVFIGCALAVKLTSKGPVFFRQTRVGKSGETFTCLKFRTMRTGSHALQEQLRSASVQDGPAFKIPKDPRITPVGRVLRKFSLDELPQLLNVLMGDMSLVGPRPPIPSEVDNYTWWQRRRISVKPGLTCLWQVWGRNRVSFKRWVEMDLYYIDNWSLWLDLKLIAHTFRAVLRGTGM
jgi:exopolysaccharide biosynthesis polyprenyl glycosylphosphotransferase